MSVERKEDERGERKKWWIGNDDRDPLGAELAPTDNIVRRIVNAWDCCGTCAGGVLARYVAERRAEAWDEGYECRGSAAASFGREAPFHLTPPNPYRTGGSDE